MAIKYILLDLDDTVYDFKCAERSAISLVLVEHGMAPEPRYIERYSEINRDCWRMLEEGKMEREQILVERFRRFFAELSVSCNPERVKDLYEKKLSESAVFVEGAEELIAGLRGKYTLAIATNGTARVQEKRISAGGLRDKVDYIFISEKLGHAKPSIKYFDACLAQLGAEQRAQVIIVGDSISSDIQGGINAGIHTCLFKRSGECSPEGVQPEYTIGALCELWSVLDRINSLEP